jgi:hypothetical protein
LAQHFSSFERKKLSIRILYPEKIFFRVSFSGKGGLKEFVTSGPILKE